MNFLDKLFSALKKSSPSVAEFHLGANIDTRPPEEQEKSSIKLGEVTSSATAPVWTVKPQSAWRTFTSFDQGGQSSCVANTAAKLLGIMRFLKDGKFVHFSPAHIYRRRSNFSGEGMIGDNAFEILTSGTTLYDLIPSDGQNEAWANALKLDSYENEVAALFKTNNPLPVHPGVGDIDAIASVIEATGKGVMVWYWFTGAEWSPLMPSTIPGTSFANALKHSVTAVDYTMYQGQKCLVIEDSAHFGGRDRRLITEAFHSARNWFAAYPMNLQVVGTVDGSTTKPKYQFSTDLKYSSTVVYLDDVKALQDILKYEGLFPANVESTGYYGTVTAQSVLAWQKRYNVDTPAVLDSLGGKSFGSKSRTVANNLYK